MSLNFAAIRKLTVVLVAAASAAACSGESPVVPSPPSVGGDLSARPGAGASGTYVISFLSGGPLVNDTLNVGQSLALKGTVTDAAGQLATQGSVAFEYCSLRGQPAPKAACESGSGAWKNHMTVRSDPSGFPPQVEWGWCSTPRSIGFRFRYSAHGSTIAAATSAPKDATWELAS